MGCDIHSYCEVEIEGMDKIKRWFCVGRVFKNPWAREDLRVFLGENGEEFCAPYTHHPIDERNYDLFGILADVRNGTWGEPLKPICERRGFPENASAFVKKEFERWGVDGHSHSFIFLEEIEKYPWNAPIYRDAAVSHEQKEEFDKTGVPPTSFAAESSHGTRIQWEEPVSSTCKYFLENTVPVLKKLSKHGRVRLVFWFDN